MKKQNDAKLPYVIYVPGLGDERTLGQDKAIKAWRVVGVQGEYWPVGWGDGEAFAPKLDRLVAHIDELFAVHGPITLMGASAGAGGVLNAAAQRPDKKSAVISICGFVRNANFKDPVFSKHPAFADSMHMLPSSLQEIQKHYLPILSVNAAHDSRVPRRDTIIDGAKTITMPMIGHVQTIAFAITFGKHRIARFIKSQSRKSATLNS